MNILLVDDDFFFQKTLNFYLHELNHQVFFAQDGQKAIEVLRKNSNIDLLICDIDMPVLSGNVFLSRLKEIYSGKLPVIAVASGLKNGREFLRRSKIQHDYYFEKPLDVNVFSKTLDLICRQRKLR